MEEAAKRGQLPTTSGSNVADMREAYEKALDLGNTVISVHVAERISVTIKSARTAKEQFFPEAPIHIVDSQQVIAGQALLVIAAAKAAQEGRSPEYILGMLAGHAGAPHPPDAHPAHRRGAALLRGRGTHTGPGALGIGYYPAMYE